MKLVHDQIIIPVGNNPNTYDGLHLKYKINKESPNKDGQLMTQIIKSIELPATLDYYLKIHRIF